MERFIERLPGETACLAAHLEGPFLDPAAAGAQALEHVRPVDLGELESWLASGRVRLVTLAPEVEHARQAIDQIVAAAQSPRSGTRSRTL